MAKPLFGDSPEPAKPLFGGEPEKKRVDPLFSTEETVPGGAASSVSRPLFSDVPSGGDSPPAVKPLDFKDSNRTAPAPTPIAAPIAFQDTASPTPPAAVPLAFKDTAKATAPAPVNLFAPGSVGEETAKPVVKETVAPQPVFMDAGQTWLTKLDEAAKRLFPDTDAAAHARMLIGWRALLPYSEKAVMMLGDRELKGAAMLATQQANAARIIAQSPVPNLLERLSKALSSSSKRSWFGVKKPEDPSRIVVDLQAQEPAIQKAFDDNQEARANTKKLHGDLEAYYQAAECLIAVGEEAWKISLENRRQLLHQAVYNLELTMAHLQQQERLLLQWREDIQRLVYLIYPTWQMGQT